MKKGKNQVTYTKETYSTSIHKSKCTNLDMIE